METYNQSRPFKILKVITVGQRTNVLLSDSEGIPLEYVNKEDADKVCKLFNDNASEGYEYKVI